MLGPMPDKPAPEDALLKEYARAFHDWDDHTLARWLAQTLGQLAGKTWRVSHPLMESYRLAAQLGHDRQIWFKRLATPPSAYLESHCCRAPLLPLLTRDVKEAGLICQHCNETLIAFEDLPAELQPAMETWAARYAPVHQVAHWEERRQKAVPSYDRAYEEAAQQAEHLLAYAGFQLAPKLLEFYPALVWEDHDECLEVRPEDITAAKASLP
ncbi:MAG TPA: hypothetical protein VFV96_09820 [Verrucomicrobiae bacterium]|nr:hypothetical protein [Verrucomicrobiae bacterium]